jgi:hypothetical protein
MLREERKVKIMDTQPDYSIRDNGDGTYTVELEEPAESGGSGDSTRVYASNTGDVFNTLNYVVSHIYPGLLDNSSALSLTQAAEVLDVFFNVPITVITMKLYEAIN